MKIYTKTGDKGETGIIGKRLKKSSQLIKTIGDIDELNASIGVCVSIGKEIRNHLPAGRHGKLENSKELINSIMDIQSTLFSIGAVLANGNVDLNFKDKINELEKSIDTLDKELTPLQNFILPGGSLLSANLHLSRTICRRAERSLVELRNNEIKKFTKEGEELYSAMLIFLNRLSDYLFIAARFVNKAEGAKEIDWKGH